MGMDKAHGDSYGMGRYLICIEIVLISLSCLLSMALWLWIQHRHKFVNSSRKVLCIGCSCKVSCLNRLTTRDSGRCESFFVWKTCERDAEVRPLYGIERWPQNRTLLCTILIGMRSGPKVSGRYTIDRVAAYQGWLLRGVPLYTQ